MNIHDLNTKTLTDPAYIAFDDGTDTYKAEFNDAVEEKAAAAVAAADLTQNAVAFTSGDAASPTAWTNVSVITSGSTLATLFNRISTMVKNVRYIWNLIGTTTMGTTATTITGAIKEHETDISTLNGNINRNDLLSLTKNSSYIGDFTNASYCLSGHIAMLNGYFRFSTTNVPQASTLFTLPSGNTFKCRQYIQIANNDFTSNVTLEVRENTAIIRAGTAFENLSTSKNYYFCFITDFA